MLEEPISSVQHPTMRSRPRRRLTRREKWPLQVGLFLLYVLIQTTTSVYTSSMTDSATPVSVPDQSPISGGKDLQDATAIRKDKDSPTRKALANDEPKTISSNSVTQAPKEPSLLTEKTLTETPKGNKQRVSIETTPETKLDSKGAEKVKTTQNPNTTGMPESVTTIINEARPTWRPRRENCSPPAIEQFPRPLVGPEARKHGALIIDILVAIYTFLGLAIVCDDYFVSSLDRICEELRLSPDVAGATFMAAGSSAPELATVVIGVFFAKDDIGVSGVIGSAVFNIMFVISVCGLFSGTVSKLNWWPLCRDCFFYMISILVMLGTIYNESISWPEALFMLFTYVVYCVVLSFNERLERWAKSLNLPYLPKDNDPAEENALVSYRSLQEERLSYTGPNSPVTDQVKSEGNMAGLQDPSDPAHPKPACPAQPQYYKAKEADPNEISPLVRPTDGGKWGLFSWGLVYPIHFMCRVTMPDCRQEKWKRWYPFTFCVSMIWISFYSYFMVWMITIIGSTLGIPDTVMGLTFVAAGVSVPDALSSLAVIKEGLGDMAVSNAVGSNVFDILVCLGLPWFIQTAMIAPGSHVNVTSRGLTYSTVSLLSTVVFLVVVTHLNGWKLDRRYGVFLMVWYLIFIAVASLYELNVFGQMNPPVCPSKF
ncbi:probable sodium/potassium/calcium exchanger CG1090 isoform X2 [Neodiprion pinetum]|uniref:Probable sodium/potassium/calcium exchanger CG1090 isoform X2 n=1 Tax=Neodiprion lecontei TaxID=441921 RepID=A0A6J0BXI1_NEOLC|nr:probable sodium/potassium/calcium exchanger CG1090 isoform X2 [Neodiprion lecontei]XP_046473922.1 probable sodium/potassium/calcium exchanger CG1090 isoform X2 [Neodiprion pinetum]